MRYMKTSATTKIWILLLVIASLISNLNAQWSGSGTLADPYLINNETDFIAFKDKVNHWQTPLTYSGVYFKLMSDLNLPNNFGTIGSYDIRRFEGNFDGNGHTITGVLLNGHGGALFRMVGPGVVISNLTIDGASTTTTGGNQGALIGMDYGLAGTVVTVINCHVKNTTINAGNQYNSGGMIGSMTGDLILQNSSVSNVTVSGAGQIGGIVGNVAGNATIENVTANNSPVTGTGSNVGGLVGRVTAGLAITGCSNNNSTTVTIKGGSGVGGLVGAVGGGISTATQNTIDHIAVIGTGNGVGGMFGNITGNANVSNCLAKNSAASGAPYQGGGIIGNIAGNLTLQNSSVSNGNISGGSQIGGVVGRIGNGNGIIEKATVRNTSASGTGSNVGGIVGYVQNGNLTITGSSNRATGTQTVSGDGGVGGLVGYISKGTCTASRDTVDNVPVTGLGYGIGGVFGWITGEATFTDIIQINGNVSSTGNNAVGGILGDVGKPSSNDTIKFINCSSMGSAISGKEHIGGISGMIRENLWARNCHSNNSVDGISISGAANTYYTGGLFGSIYENGDIEDVSHTNGTIAGCEMVGGIVGGANGSKMRIVNARKTGGSITAASKISARVGSIIGKTEGISELRNCYGETDVKATAVEGKYAGGIIGTVFGSTNLYDCQFKGTVEGAISIGGLIGSIGSVDRGSLEVGDAAIYASNSVSYLVNSTSIKGDSAVGGLIGSVGVYLTSAQEAAYAGQNVGTLSYQGNATTTSVISNAITGKQDVGGLVGLVKGTANINNASVNAPITVSKKNGGGLCGYVSGKTTISISSHSGLLTQTNSVDNVGGIAGNIQDTLILNTVAHTGNISGRDNIGGFAGNVGDVFEVNNSPIGTTNAFITISGRSNIGGFAGYVGGKTTVNTSNSYSAISASGDNAGGMCGSVLSKTNISNSSHSGTVTGTGVGSDNAGGIVGVIYEELTLTNVSHTGDISANDNVGGLVGNVEGVFNISGSSVGTSNSLININGASKVGGLAGYVGEATVIETTNVYSNINLTGAKGGGLCGAVADQTNISLSSHTGTVNGTEYLGGVVGEVDSDVKFEDVIHTGNVSGTTNVGGFGGYITGGVSSLEGCSSVGKIYSSGNYVGGLFGQIGGACTIHKKSHFKGKIIGTDFVGGFIGRGNGALTISNVSQDADSISGRNVVGGFVGVANNIINIDSAYVVGNLYATGDTIGGMIALHSGTKNVKIKNSYYEGDVIQGVGSIGGFVGSAISSGQTVIDSCYTHIKEIKATGNYIGGLIGQSGSANSLKITNSFNDGDRIDGKGTITGANYMGGLVGNIANNNSSIVSSFNRSHVNGQRYIGGLLGYTKIATTISHSYNTGNVNGTTGDAGGIIGYNLGTVNLQSVYNIGKVSGGSNLGAIAGIKGTITGTNHYTVPCVANGLSGYNGTVKRADYLSSPDFATLLGTPFRYVQYSLPKLPITNHLFVGVVSDSLDSAPIYCAYDVSIGKDFNITFSDPIVRLKDNDQKIRVYPSASYSINNLTKDHLIIPYYSYSLYGTVFPFVKTNDPIFDSAFVITATLYKVPDASANSAVKRMKAIANSTPLAVDTLLYYDGRIYIPGTPKNPGDFEQTNNPGKTINWAMLDKTVGTIDNSTVKRDSIPTKPVGYYNFNDVPGGEYILQISRQGYLVRYAKITVSQDDTLGHREILAGDVNHTNEIDGEDMSLLIEHYSNYGDSKYNPKFDFNGDKKIDAKDYTILMYNIAASYCIYKETNDWLTE